MNIFITLVCVLVSIYFTWKITYKRQCQKKSEVKDQYNKYYHMYYTLEKWLEGVFSDRKIGLYIKKNNWNTVAIYGCGDIGRLLYRELEMNNVQVVCGIDKNTELSFPTKIVTPEKFSEKVDAVIVTSIAYFGEIEYVMSKITEAEIISLEDIVYQNVY